jgi:hypothetical protein
MISPLGDLLARYRAKMKAPVGTVVDSFIEVAKGEGILLQKKQCSYNPHARTLSVGAGMQRTEVLLKKARLLAGMRAHLGEQNCPKDII